MTHVTQHDREMAEIREIMKNTAISQPRTDKKIKEVAVMLGNYGLVQG